MVFSKMNFQSVVVNIILLLSLILSVTDVTSFVLVTAVCIQLIVTVEPLSAETAFWVTFEAALVNCAWVVVTKLLMLLEFIECK